MPQVTQLGQNQDWKIDPKTRLMSDESRQYVVHS